MSDYPWKASEVWGLVRDWPEEARPTNMEWFTQGSRAGWFDDAYVCVAHTAALHVASGLEWLARKHRLMNVPISYDCDHDTPTDEWWNVMEPSPESPAGPTLLHAVSAAIAAVTSGG